MTTSTLVLHSRHLAVNTWGARTFHARGRIYGDNRFPEGTPVTTSPVNRIRMDANGVSLQTMNTLYRTR